MHPKPLCWPVGNPSFEAGVNMRHSAVGVALAVVALPDFEWGFDMHIEIGRVMSVGLAAHTHGQHHQVKPVS